MDFLIKLFKKFNRLVEKAENHRVSLETWLITFFCIIFLRNFLELFSTKTYYLSSKNYLFFFFHSAASYFFIFLAIILILYFFTKERIEKISRLAIWGALIILLPPIIDIIATGGEGAIIKYRPIEQIGSVWQGIKLFFGYIFYGPFGLLYQESKNFPLAQPEINYGIRIEVLLVLLSLIWYIFLKTKNILKTLGGLFFAYFAFFIFGSFPYWMALLFGALPQADSFHGATNLDPSFDWNKIVFFLYFIFLIVFGLVWFYVYNKEKFWAAIKNFRFVRIINNLLFLFVGLFIALRFNPRPIVFKSFDYLLVLSACLAIIFYWLFAIFSNDIADEKADRISSPGRPLPSGTLAAQEIKSLALIFQVASYTCAFIVSYAFFVIVFIRSCLGYLYSWFPFRLKRIPVLSSFLLAVGYWLTMLAGYLILSSNSAYNFPWQVNLIVLLGFTLAANFRDIKDYQGDKEDKTYTLLVIAGLKRGKIIVGFLGGLAFLLFPLVYQEYFKITLIPSLAAALGYFYLVNKKNYQEKLIFLLIFMYIILIIFLVQFLK